jgi:outer membrane lipoprotein-sorting protein
MHLGNKLAIAALVALVLASCRTAAFAAVAPDEKEKVLRQLDEAAKNFRSTSADFQFDSVETDPIPNTDIQKGKVYYERKGNSFRMAAHIDEFNKKPAMKVYTYSGGVFQLYEGGDVNQVTTYSKIGKFESYLMLGFGASGEDLEKKWEIKYLGAENLLDGKTSVKTEKLELVAKDPEVRKNLPKVTIWIDPERGVSLKQVFDEGPGEHRDCVYFNIKVNQTLPSDAFTFKTDSKTTHINR